MSAFDPKQTSALVQLIAQNTMHAVLGRKEMATKEIEVAVVGGGIGGLAAAISLRRAGFDVHVYEQSRAMRESRRGSAS
jgi:NADPH-dependent 2,4-dienoyl-CoA reductase/sulfur reductase-like enzyme